MITRANSDPLEQPALGELIDYRVELGLGLTRVFEMSQSDEAIFVGSIIDNLAHHYVNYEISSASGVEDEAIDTRNYLTAAMLYAILIDSLYADVIAYLPSPEATDYEARVDEFYKEILRFFGASYLTLDGTLEENITTVSGEIDRLLLEDREADGPIRDNSESSEEESQ